MMRRTFLLLLCACLALANQGSVLHFTEQPITMIKNVGERVVLHCKTNLPVIETTWYFKDFVLSPDSDSGTKSQRLKRNREDRELSHSTFNQYLNSQSSTRRIASESGRSNVLPISNRKKVRRRKGHRRRDRPDSEELVFGNRYIRSTDGVKSSSAKTHGIQIRDGRLVIRSLSKENEGDYFCTATSPQGSIRSSTATVQVAYISNFTFSAPRSVVPSSFPAFVLPCHLPRSVPSPVPRWRVNGEVLNENVEGPYLVMRSGNLLIKNVTASAGSTFQCGAHNLISSETKFASAATLLPVSGGTASEARTDRIYPASDKSINVTGEVGNDLLMECISSDLSKSVWTRDNGPVPDHAEITNVGLKITVKSSDAGQYSCKSPTTGRSVLYVVTISGVPSVRSVTADHVTFQSDSDVISLKCALNSGSMVDSKWEWYNNSERISEASGPEFNISARSGYYGGFYQCFAKTVFGMDHAVFFVEGANPSTSDSTLPPLEDYFNAAEDRDAVLTPQISRSQAPKQPTSHLLVWKMSGTEPRLFSIKYYKEPYVDAKGNVVNYDSTVVNVPGDRREVTLNDLSPLSAYVVEMVAVSDAGTRSEVAISTFGTSGHVADIPPLSGGPGISPTDKPKQSGPRVKVPKTPSRPVVSDNSFHEVSLMWNARGNGGSPIIGYKIQRKETESKGGWKTIGSPKTFPFPITDLERGKSYKFRVIAYNAVGDSSPSSASTPYPKRRRQQRLIEAPKIVKASTQGLHSIIIKWKYDHVPVSSINGYHIYYRPTDSDDEKDYTKKTYASPTANSYVINNLKSETQYDVKIQAFNDHGPSTFSNVMILEMPKSGDPTLISVVPKTEPPIDPGPYTSDPAQKKAEERNTIFLITGGVFGAILLVLLVTVFCYWRRPAARNAQSTPEMKLKNGNVSGYTQGKPSNNINMKKLNSNGHPTPNRSDSPHHHSNTSQHNTRCQCSRHHSNQSSLGREASFHPYTMPPGPGWVPDPGWDPSNYPSIHSNPMHMYMDPRHPYFAPHGIGRWVRNGEFCHIVPVDTRKVSTDGGPEVIGHYLHPGGHMVTRTYDGNFTQADDDSAHRPDHGYHSNEEGARTASDSQADKSDEATQEDDANSAGGATSGIVTLNDVTIESRPSSPSTREDDPLSDDLAIEAANSVLNTEISRSDSKKDDMVADSPRASAAGENTPFLSEDSTSSNNESPKR